MEPKIYPGSGECEGGGWSKRPRYKETPPASFPSRRLASVQTDVAQRLSATKSNTENVLRSEENDAHDKNSDHQDH